MKSFEEKIAELRNRARDLQICPNCFAAENKVSEGHLLCEACEKKEAGESEPHTISSEDIPLIREGYDEAVVQGFDQFHYTSKKNGRDITLDTRFAKSLLQYLDQIINQNENSGGEK